MMIRKAIAAAVLAVGATVATSTPALADTVSVPGIGSLSFDSSGTNITDYSYNIGVTTPLSSYNLSSSGTPDGFGSTQNFTSGQFQTNVEQNYGGYEGATCLICDERSVTLNNQTVSSDTNVFTNQTPTWEFSSPGGEFSLP